MRAAASPEWRVTGLTGQMGKTGEQSSSGIHHCQPGCIHLIINAFQLVANKREATGHAVALKEEEDGANLRTNMNQCMLAHTSPCTHPLSAHTKPMPYLLLGAPHWSRPRRAYSQPRTGTFLCRTGSDD